MDKGYNHRFTEDEFNYLLKLTGSSKIMDLMLSKSSYYTEDGPLGYGGDMYWDIEYTSIRNALSSGMIKVNKDKFSWPATQEEFMKFLCNYIKDVLKLDIDKFYHILFYVCKKYRFKHKIRIMSQDFIGLNLNIIDDNDSKCIGSKVFENYWPTQVEFLEAKRLESIEKEPGIIEASLREQFLIGTVSDNSLTKTLENIPEPKFKWYQRLVNYIRRNK